MTKLLSFLANVLLLLFVIAAAHAAPTKKFSGGPEAIGTFGKWIAATYHDQGQLICFAFTRATSSSRKVARRGDAILTVTLRPSERNVVAIDAGFSYADNAIVHVQVDKIGLEFYARGRGAFATNGNAAVSAFESGDRAIARSIRPRNQEVADTFGLKGFSAAYKAMSKKCPLQ
jgi:invasion associated locus B (IalB) protein